MLRASSASDSGLFSIGFVLQSEPVGKSVSIALAGTSTWGYICGVKVIIPGGSGFLGQSLAGFLEARGHEVRILTRRPRAGRDVAWDAKTPGPWTRELDGADAVVNMTGKSVNCIYTPENRREIIDSRIDSVRVLQEAIRAAANPPRVFVQAGSLAIYGDTTEPCGEDAPHGEGFSVQVCEAWEEQFFSPDLPGVRRCNLRIGFVLGPNGGALLPLRKLARGFLGGTVGDGGQYISWLHIDDLNRMVLACLEDGTMSGTYNATGPAPVTNREFMRALRAAVDRPWSPPAPSLAVRFGAHFILKSDASLALTGRKCYPRRLEEHGFTFNHTDLDATLRDVMAQWDDSAATAA